MTHISHNVVIHNLCTSIDNNKYNNNNLKNFHSLTYLYHVLIVFISYDTQLIVHVNVEIYLNFTSTNGFSYTDTRKTKKSTYLRKINRFLTSLRNKNLNRNTSIALTLMSFVNH